MLTAEAKEAATATATAASDVLSLPLGFLYLVVLFVCCLLVWGIETPMYLQCHKIPLTPPQRSMKPTYFGGSKNPPKIWGIFACHGFTTKIFGGPLNLKPALLTLRGTEGLGKSIL